MLRSLQVSHVFIAAVRLWTHLRCLLSATVVVIRDIVVAGREVLSVVVFVLAFKVAQVAWHPVAVR